MHQLPAIFAHSGENDHLFRQMAITQTGRWRSPRPADGDHSIRCLAITPKRDNAGNRIIPL